MATSTMTLPTTNSSAADTTLAQLSSFHSTTRCRLHRLSFPLLRPSKVSALISVGSGRLRCHKPNYQDNVSSPPDGILSEQQVSLEEKEGEDDGVVDPLRVYGTAKIHDFCFGIPFGGIVLSGGVVGFIFSRNPTVLGTGVLFGGALLALSSCSLKVWRQGLSSLPFVLGQAVLSGFLSWKSFQAYSLTNKLIPSGIFAVISAAMFCFYSYVMISGGNPPPKKLQASATVSN